MFARRWHMNFIDKAMDLWKLICSKLEPILTPVGRFLKELGGAFRVIGKYLYRFRKVFLAVPVVWGAIYLAIYNLEHLPTVVGINLQNSGEFSIQVVKELAVLGPIALTALCLLLMFISRRTLTPWIVSIFTLVLPILLLITNIFPA